MHHLVAGPGLTDVLAPYRAVDRSSPRGACWVMGHMVTGIDGSAAIHGRVGALSTPPDQALFGQMRELADVVLVGAETVRREGYGAIRLSERARRQRSRAGMPPTPPVAIVSKSLDLNWSAAVFADAPEDARTLVVTCSAAPLDRRESAAAVADLVVAGQESVDPRQLLVALADRGHRVVLCEGGPTWLGQLTAAGCLDELCLSVAPVMGGDPLPVAVTPTGGPVTEFELRHVLADGGTLFLRYEAKAGRR